MKDGLAVTQVDVTALEGSCARCKDMGVSVEHSQLRYVPAAMSCSLTRGPGAVQGKPVLNIFPPWRAEHKPKARSCCQAWLFIICVLRMLNSTLVLYLGGRR